MSIPAWIYSSIFYQIFPDRFNNGDHRIDPPNVHKWQARPTGLSFFGGDLQGIEDKLDYLQHVGVNSLYLNPIFLSPSTHRYNAVDYYQIDPKLGDLQDFRDLVHNCHSRKMKVILDGVFNHCGRGFFAFSDVLENGENSPYKDWFFINRYPLDAYSAGDAKDYIGWWNHKSLPKLNTRNKKVREYLFNVARFWILQGADGWRLDVPNEIDDDGFWDEFREVVRRANPDAYLLGEIWDINPRWVGDRHFDGLMNYPFRAMILDLLERRISVQQYGQQIERLLQAYPEENNYAQFNLVGSHDVERIATIFRGDTHKIKQAMFLQFTFLGCPSIYYGDEVGVEGGKDPDCRRTFPWERTTVEHELTSWIRKLIEVRLSHKEITLGNYVQVNAGHDGLLCFSRSVDKATIYGLLNLSSSAAEFTMPDLQRNPSEGKEIVDILSSKNLSGSSKITILPNAMMLLKNGRI